MINLAPILSYGWGRTLEKIHINSFRNIQLGRNMRIIDRELLISFLDGLNVAFASPGRFYLIGEASQLFEGWREWIDHGIISVKVLQEDRARFDEAFAIARNRFGLDIIEESPGDLIPLPKGHNDRARSIQLQSCRKLGANGLRFYHFDPYSVAFRFMARGDEPDYNLVIDFLKHGWLTFEEMEAKLQQLLPEFSYETIQQDPAEFRRKFKGLLQMWKTMQSRIS